MTLNKKQLQALTDWHAAKDAADKVKHLMEIEREARKKVIELLFPNPLEGVNNCDINNGYCAKLTYPMRREIDKAALNSVLANMPEGSADRLITYKPLLDVREYRKLDDQQRHIFDEAVITKPGSPKLEILAPKTKAKE